MKKIAISREGRLVCKHFGHCEGFEVIELEGDKISSRKFLPNPGHRPGFLPKYLSERNIDVIISGGMGATAQEIFRRENIEVIVGVEDDLEKVIESYLKGNLKSTEAVCSDHKYEKDCHK